MSQDLTLRIAGYVSILSLPDTSEGHLRRAIYRLVHSIADAKVQTILLTEWTVASKVRDRRQITALNG